MHCRALIALAVAASLHTAPVRAETDEEKALGLLLAASAQTAIITFCAQRYTIDGTTALRISQTARDVAAKVLGQERAAAAFKEELARRFEEVRWVGKAQWCATQREAFAQGEARIFKD